MIPKTRTGQVISNQLVRSGTSVGANYRAACRAKSRADFVSKMGTVEEEIDESLYWMEILMDAKLLQHRLLDDCMKEASELLAITVASIQTAKKNK